PPAVAGDFLSSAMNKIPNPPGTTEELLSNVLKVMGLSEESIDPRTPLSELLYGGLFLGRLQPVAGLLGISWAEIGNRVSCEQIPSWIVDFSLRKYRQDQ